MSCTLIRPKLYRFWAPKIRSLNLIHKTLGFLLTYRKRLFFYPSIKRKKSYSFIIWAAVGKGVLDMIKCPFRSPEFAVEEDEHMNKEEKKLREANKLIEETKTKEFLDKLELNKFS